LPLIIGHRGSSTVAPENTLVAFSQALRDRADGIELDVRLARDGVPVVIHDADLWRTGRRKASVARTTSERLGSIDVGSWFNEANPRSARKEYAREFVPTLAEVFALFKRPAHRRALIYVELKTEADSCLDLCQAVAEVISEFRFARRVVIVSFDLKAVGRMKTIESSVSTGALFEPKRSALKIMSARRLIKAALDCGADEILLHRLSARRRLVQLAQEANLRSVVWTVDDPGWVRRRVDYGLHAIMTNNPAGLRVALASAKAGQ
jgi:glycerophosphoryl diester phosphodiesterase